MLVVEFGEAAAKAGIEGWPCPVRPELLPTPHRKPSLPMDEAAVYAFALSADCTAPMWPGNGIEGR